MKKYLKLKKYLTSQFFFVVGTNLILAIVVMTVGVVYVSKEVKRLPIFSPIEFVQTPTFMFGPAKEEEKYCEIKDCPDFPIVDPPPSKVKVGPYIYSIHGRSHKDMERVDMLGGTNNDYKLIVLDISLPHSELQETLLHELTHAAAKNGNHRASTSGMSEDDFIESVVPTQLQILRDNPEVTKWLLKEEK